MNLNAPVWNANATSAKPGTRASAFQESWNLRFSDPDRQRGLWIRFGILISGNGFKKVSEVSVTSFSREGQRETFKFALRQTFDIQSFSFKDGASLEIQNCVLGPQRSRGTIQSKGNTFSWDLSFIPRADDHYELIPRSAKRVSLLPHSLLTAHSDILVSGKTEWNGEALEWKNVPGMQGHQSGKKAPHSWVWGQCNSFVTETGSTEPMIFEGMTMQAVPLGLIPLPISSFYFRYAGRNHFFNSLRDLFRIRSVPEMNQWNFQADRGDLSFRGEFRADHKEFAGLTLEDTDGSLIYLAHSELAALTLHVYRRGKLEAAYRSAGSAAFEIASRKRNPYVASII